MKTTRRPSTRPNLTRAEAQLAYDGISALTSDYNDAPHDAIRKLQAKLIKMGAKGTVYA